MADNTQSAKPDIKSKITMAMLGNPKAGAAFKPGDGQRHFLARVKGFASGQVQKLDERGDPLYGLKGQFVAEMSDGKKLQSGVLYLPSGIQEAVSEAVPDGDGRVGFVFDIFTEAATNKAGYSYVVTPVFQPVVEDPFAAFGELPALPAPAK